MITKIKLNQLATFTNEVTISDLNSINFFYGDNGSGKTTITKLITSPDAYPSCYIEWLENKKLKAIVYNEDFVKKYFYQTDKFPGIFTIGEGAKEIEEEIQNKKEQIDKLTKNSSTLDNTQRTRNDEKKNSYIKYKDDCWKDIYLKYKDDFDHIFTGCKNSKENFATKILNTNITSQPLISLEDLNKRYRLLFKEELNKVDKLPLINDSLMNRVNEIENNEILKTKIIGKQDVDIAKMIHKLQNHDWIQKGKEYYDKNYDEDSKDYICPFCQQRTSEDFRKQLEDYFDETYTLQMNSLEKINNDYKNATQQIESFFDELYKITTNNYLTEKIKLLKDKSNLIKAEISSNKGLLQNKKVNSSSKIDLISIVDNINEFNNILKKINNEIDERNSLIENKKDEKIRLKSEIWQYFSNKISNTTSHYLKNKENAEVIIRNIQKQIDEINNTIDRLTNEISELEEQIKGVAPTVDQINKLLQKFDFNGFKLKLTDDNKHYEIIRENGTQAKETLSEGERNFIVFLYFYSLIQGVLNPKENITGDKIVVIDDPVSSLDSKVLFIIATLIKNLLLDSRKHRNNIKQIFILTHNTYFHKEVTFCPGKNRNNKNDTKYFIIYKINNISQIKSFDDNPIKTTYQLLWNELKEESIGCITLQNTMRRIIEFYFKILANLDYDKLLEKFPDQTDKNICRSLISWMNIGSHEVFDDINFTQNNENIKIYKEVFKNIFDKTGHISHYNMMMNISE